MAIFTAFLDRVIPDSTNVNPACIKKTNIPERSIQSIPMSPLILAISSAKSNVDVASCAIVKKFIL